MEVARRGKEEIKERNTGGNEVSLACFCEFPTMHLGLGLRVGTIQMNLTLGASTTQMNHSSSREKLPWGKGSLVDGWGEEKKLEIWRSCGLLELSGEIKRKLWVEEE